MKGLYKSSYTDVSKVIALYCKILHVFYTSILQSLILWCLYWYTLSAWEYMYSLRNGTVLWNQSFRVYYSGKDWSLQIMIQNKYNLKGTFSSGIDGALESTWNHDFNWKLLSEISLCIFLLMFSKFIWVTLIQKQQKYK